jgi:hypothetical protein
MIVFCEIVLKYLLDNHVLRNFFRKKYLLDDHVFRRRLSIAALLRDVREKSRPENFQQKKKIKKISKPIRNKNSLRHLFTNLTRLEAVNEVLRTLLK